MKQKLKLPFSHLNFDNWQNLLIVGLCIFYLTRIVFSVAEERFLKDYGVDYLAFWSAGKIADEKGYSEIYNLEILRNTQTRVLEDQGILVKGEGTISSPFPAPIFSIFVIPFQLLSRVNPEQSYWFWTGINLSVLIGYLLFFLRKTLTKNTPFSSTIRMLLLMLLSFPVVLSMTEGQVEVLLIVCMGEFIRNALNRKPFPSGMWMGGLLLKPQLLVIIIPILILQKNWKLIIGFFASSGVIIGSSVILSGTQGMRSLIDLWTQFGSGIATSSPESMINWRMIAENMDSPFGWTIAILGMSLTCLAIIYLVRNNISFGTPQWVMMMLGIFSATLAITWHSHFHMATVLIPFLMYSSLSQMLKKKVVLYWAVSTPMILFVGTVSALIVFIYLIIIISDFKALLGISGFISNYLIFGSVLQYFRLKNKMPEAPTWEKLAE